MRKLLFALLAAQALIAAFCLLSPFLPRGEGQEMVELPRPFEGEWMLEFWSYDKTNMEWHHRCFVRAGGKVLEYRDGVLAQEFRGRPAWAPPYIILAPAFYPPKLEPARASGE